jgi:hypothetical protein
VGAGIQKKEDWMPPDLGPGQAYQIRHDETSGFLDSGSSPE